MYVVGTDTTKPSIDARGPWLPGTNIKIQNSGYILGRGGNSGARSVTSVNTNISGGNGGTAIIGQSDNPVYVENNTAYGAKVQGGVQVVEELKDVLVILTRQ